MTVLQVCDEYNIAEQTFYRWKKELGLLEVKQAKRLKDLEAKNKRLKKIVADQVLGMALLSTSVATTDRSSLSTRCSSGFVMPVSRRSTLIQEAPGRTDLLKAFIAG